MAGPGHKTVTGRPEVLRGLSRHAGFIEFVLTPNRLETTKKCG
jgi:hypothetical protein